MGREWTDGFLQRVSLRVIDDLASGSALYHRLWDSGERLDRLGNDIIPSHGVTFRDTSKLGFTHRTVQPLNNSKENENCKSFTAVKICFVLQRNF